MENSPVPLLVKHVRQAWRGPDTIAAEWQDLGFTAAPDFDRAVAEHDRFAAVLEQAGAHLTWLPAGEGVGLDSIYVRDASIMGDRGLILAQMGKAQRRGEPAAQGLALEALHFPIAGAIEPPGTVEGGDVTWLDERTMVVGRGYRTNDEGIRQLRGLVSDRVEMVVVPLPHWRGPGDVFHLMSILSPVDRNLAVVYAPLLPASFHETLAARGIELIDVPHAEFETMGANVLAVAPRRCVVLSGNPITRARLERAGAHVFEYGGEEISLKGGGGPTCLTRPLILAP